jgi:hypothetical protein
MNCWRSCGSGAFVCWAKAGAAKPIASPTRATTKRILGFWEQWNEESG